MRETTLHSALKQRVKEVIFNHIEANYSFELFGEDATAEDVESHIDKMSDIDLIQYLIQIIEGEV